MFKIYLVSDKKRIDGQNPEWKKRHPNTKRGIEKGALVLEIW
jgi:hypothetical protein